MICWPFSSFETSMMTTRMRSPWFHISPRDCSLRGTIASRLLPRSMIMSPRSKRFTVPFISSPLRSMYSSYTFSRIASRTFCTSICFAVCAAMRPISSRLSGRSSISPISISSPASSCASSSDNSLSGSSTSSTTVFCAETSISPSSAFHSTWTESPVLSLNCLRAAARTASFIASMTISRSRFCSLHKASILCPIDEVIARFSSFLLASRMP